MASANARPATSLGIDFGTTNSSVALAHADGRMELATFPAAAGPSESFRSVLYLEQARSAGRTLVKSFTGPAAIEQYVRFHREGAEVKGRLILSLKSYLSSRTLTGTEVFGRRYTLEDLVSRMLGDLRLAAEKQFGEPVRHATVGRPVRFVGAETAADDLFALGRLRAAFAQAGFESVAFELEPVAAARAYEATLDRDQLILIGDFGGGTSDFSLLRVGPGIRRRRTRRPGADGGGTDSASLLGNAGLGLAGDAFDARIVRKLVSPVLGSDSYERQAGKPAQRTHAARNHASQINGPKLIPAVPAWIYANLERWHYLSFLKTRNVAEILRGARARAAEPEKIAALVTLIEEDLGYQLHQAVERLKVELSQQQSAVFRFRDGSMEDGSLMIEAEVTRADFERWIAAELGAIERCVDGLLAASGIAADQVDRVFLTGGTSLVPAVRRIFARRFGERGLAEPTAGAERVVAGNEFTSVARGLALCGLEASLEQAESAVPPHGGLARGRLRPACETRPLR